MNGAGKPLQRFETGSAPFLHTDGCIDIHYQVEYLLDMLLHCCIAALSFSSGGDSGLALKEKSRIWKQSLRRFG